jgi:hypothetical protein
MIACTVTTHNQLLRQICRARDIVSLKLSSQIRILSSMLHMQWHGKVGRERYS